MTFGRASALAGAVCLALTSSPAAAMDFAARVEALMAEQVSYFVNGEVVPHGFRYKTDAVTKAEADYLGLDIDAYLSRAMAGFEQSHLVFTPVSREVCPDRIRYGRSGEMDWALVPVWTVLKHRATGEEGVGGRR